MRRPRSPSSLVSLVGEEFRVRGARRVERSIAMLFVEK
jgi:hypothetical protein